MADTKEYFCEKCTRTKKATAFYSSHLDKYKNNDGKLHICKDCLTMKVDNWDPETYLWILQECDVPYIPEEWNKLMMTYAKDRAKVSGTTIIGRYLSKMKLKQHKDFRWKDNEFLQERANAKIKETMERSGYDAQQIQEAIDKATYAIPDKPLEIPSFETSSSPNDQVEDYFAEQAGVVEDDLDLTEEDRKYLLIKWGKAYKPEEWVRLEQLYNEMMDSYDIQSAGHIDTLKFICKTSLKANQLIDIGDVEGAQKMLRTYNDLMKSGNFTAAQNKADSGDFVDSIGELIELCEKEGYIERFYVDQPNDRVDFTLRDMQRYTKTLITEETNLGNMIEQALKENSKEDKESAENTELDIVDDDDLAISEIENQLEDSDFEDFNEFVDGEKEKDKFLDAVQGSLEEDRDGAQ